MTDHAVTAVNDRGNLALFIPRQSSKPTVLELAGRSLSVVTGEGRAGPYEIGDLAAEFLRAKPQSGVLVVEHEGETVLRETKVSCQRLGPA